MGKKAAFEPAQRLKELPPYVFAEIEAKKKELEAKGVEIIDLGRGDPDLPTPPHIVERLKDALQEPGYNRYPSYVGITEFRRAAARWYNKRFGVTLDPETQVISLIGSKEGVSHAPMAYVDEGDIALFPDPCFPIFYTAILFAKAQPFAMPLLEENDFLPDLGKIPPQVAERAKLLSLNYPNNPTTGVATKDFFREVVRFAKKHHLMVLQDLAYSEIFYDGHYVPSILEVDGAMDVAIESHSLSKTYNMAGWRIGFAVGNAELIRYLSLVKTNIDVGIFEPIQMAGVAALEGDQSGVEELRRIYQRRRDILVAGLRQAGLEFRVPLATFYLWVRVPAGYTSASFADHLLEKAGIMVTPGHGFGKAGEGYVRFAFTSPAEALQEAARRLAKLYGGGT
ncbi:MAG: LL-diaminopimelate aminotransferase [Deltaproteobacteria bacterium RBG_16_54_18]|nr:MAG: LL-diaminopimelate aminotransferase [Deltaproteobacteria bacterium RBG_16_54_18]